jgi:hypothetical protein
MSLQDAIKTFLDKHIKQLLETYLWKFSTDNLPINFNSYGTSDYENSLNLRKHLHKSYLTNANGREGIQKWYVTDWGGVRSNRNETLKKYCELSASELISLGSKGIASWSKMLSIRDPSQYCIYDARVGFSLNAIQVIYKVDRPLYFPLLPSRNTLIRSSEPYIKELFKEMPVVKNFYTTYNDILKIYCKYNHAWDIQSAEMVLFSQAPSLASQIRRLTLG